LLCAYLAARSVEISTAWNGTLVMNIGPASDGRIPPIFLDRFQEIGDWLSVNGEAIVRSVSETLILD
jgi:alpha-L-fucosidase